MLVEITPRNRRKNLNNTCNNLLKRILIIVPVIAFIILVSGMAQAFEDDFSTDDQMWKSESTDSTYFIDHDLAVQNVQFKTSRGSIQKMYHEITPIEGDFKLRVDANLESINGNGFIYIGLTDDIDDVPARWWEGPGIEIGQYNGYYADVAGRYADGTVFVSMSDDPNTDKSIPISTNKWYTFELTRAGQTWKLDARDRDTNVLVESITGEFTGSFTPFKYVFFGNGDTSQNEIADGRLDNIKLYTATKPNGLIAYYPFDDGTARDSSGNGNDGITKGATPSEGKINNAMHFDGINDYIEIPRSIQDSFSIVFWVKTTQTGGSTHQWWAGYGLVDADVCGETNDFGISLAEGKACFGIGKPGLGNDITIKSNKIINDGVWHQIAATRSKETGEMILYIDGSSEITGISSTESLTMPPYIGIGNEPCNVYYNRRWFNGDIDDVRIYNSILSPEEINDLATPSASSIGGFVWNDVNMNGIQDPNEDGISGIDVYLYKSGITEVFKNIKTDLLGKYSFNDLSAGEYQLQFVPPPLSPYVFSPMDQGGDNTKDSDVDTSTGRTEWINLEAGTKIDNCDAGMYNSNFDLIWPVTSRVINEVYGDFNNEEIHPAIDIQCEKGQEVIAADSGTVEYVYNGEGANKALFIRNAKNEIIEYVHVQNTQNLEENSPVKQGQKIGNVVENTDIPTHLHFGIVGGTTEDIKNSLPADNPNKVLVELEGVQNPLLRLQDASSIYKDRMPVIAGIAFREDDGGKESNYVYKYFDELEEKGKMVAKLHGKVDIVVNAYENFGGEDAGIYKIGYKIEDAGGNLVKQEMPIFEFSGKIDPQIRDNYINKRISALYQMCFTYPCLYTSELFERWYIITNKDYDKMNCWNTQEEIFKPGLYKVTVRVEDTNGGHDESYKYVKIEPTWQFINNYIQGLPSSAFNNPKLADVRKNALSNKFNAIRKQIENSEYEEAIDKLQIDIRTKADGSVDGNPDNDWITDAEVQKEICKMIDDLVTYLETLCNESVTSSQQSGETVGAAKDPRVQRVQESKIQRSKRMQEIATKHRSTP